jgi:hypothetical protein
VPSMQLVVTTADTIGVDLLISLVLGVVVLVILAVWIMSAVGIGAQFFDPLVAFVGAPVIWLSRSMKAIRRKRSINKLPAGVPPPPSVP